MAKNSVGAANIIAVAVVSTIFVIVMDKIGITEWVAECIKKAGL